MHTSYFIVFNLGMVPIGFYLYNSGLLHCQRGNVCANGGETILNDIRGIYHTNSLGTDNMTTKSIQNHQNHMHIYGAYCHCIICKDDKHKIALFLC